MPDQPPDPIHYEMKIPPEPKESSDGHAPEKPPAGDNTQVSHTAKDSSVVRGDDKPQSVRPAK
jgi:hypothetical protein